MRRGNNGLWQVTAPYFCAGLVLRAGVVVKTAPILYWCRGKKRDGLARVFRSKGWAIRLVRED